MKQLICLVFLVCTFGMQAQNGFSFKPTTAYKIVENGDSLSLAWAGGFNQPQFSSFDLNNDGQPDLVVFERVGNRIIPFLNVVINGNHTYRYAPNYIDSFPVVTDWMQLVDYNCDGKKDLFTSNTGSGIISYKNVGKNGGTRFALDLPTGYNFIPTDYFGTPGNLYHAQFDIAGITDVDDDGDIDILTYGQGNTVVWHENIANCGLQFSVNTECWGRFVEGNLDNNLSLDACGTYRKTEQAKHSGSSILVIDLDGDDVKDIIIGDISFNNAIAAYNTGTKDTAFMSSEDTIFPSYNTPVDLQIFPAFFYEDADFDGVKDLIVAPNSLGSKNVNNVLLYKNTGTNGHPNFNYTDSAFLQRHMIDLGEGAIPVVVDINFDGLPDLFVANSGQLMADGNYRTYISYYKNTGTTNTPEFTLQTRDLNNLSQQNMGKSLAPTFGDLDGDVDLDMLIGTTDGKLYYFENTGGISTPSFTFVSSNYSNIDVGSNAAPFLFDIDKDLDLDLFIGEEMGNVNYYENQGTANAANFVLINETYGGIDVRTTASAEGNSKPVLFRVNDSLNLFVGSFNAGIVQYDSIAKVNSLPAFIDGTIGTGTDTTSGYNLTPFGTTKRNGRNQLLYRASELKAAGFQYGKITSLSFNVSNVPNTYVSQGFRIGMKNVNMQSITQWETNTTTVYEYIYPMVKGWNEVTLSTPFLWDGVSDLLIEICFAKNFPSDKQIALQCTDVGFASNAYGDVSIWNQNIQDGCQMPYKAASTLRPNIKMKITPTLTSHHVFNGYGLNTAPTIGNMNNDTYMDMIVGNQAGGITFYSGIKYDKTIGITENAIARIPLKVYPNPTTGLVHIEMPENINTSKATVQLFDLAGKIVAEKNVNSFLLEMNLSDYPNGVYIMMLSDQKNTYYQRLVLQH